jgi:hypothetical protein
MVPVTTDRYSVVVVVVVAVALLSSSSLELSVLSLLPIFQQTKWTHDEQGTMEV